MLCIGVFAVRALFSLNYLNAQHPALHACASDILHEKKRGCHTAQDMENHCLIRVVHVTGLEAGKETQELLDLGFMLVLPVSFLELVVAKARCISRTAHW